MLVQFTWVMWLGSTKERTLVEGCMWSTKENSPQFSEPTGLELEPTLHETESVGPALQYYVLRDPQVNILCRPQTCYKSFAQLSFP